MKDRNYHDAEEEFKKLLEKMSVPQEDIFYLTEDTTSHFRLDWLLDFLNAIPRATKGRRDG